jgi:hypothetical protein
MSRRAGVCVVNAERGTVNPATLNCGDQSHFHISQAEARIQEKSGEVEWVKEPKSRGDRGIVRLLKENYSIRGLSAKVGQTLATAVQNREPWALVMQAEMRH